MAKSAPSAETLAKRARRAQREIELAAKIRALPTRKFGLVYADPPWRFEVRSHETGLDRDASNHYPVMELEAIKKLAVPSIAAPDCVLALWATSPMLPQALEVMVAWGFEYCSQAVWVKNRIGTGFWFRGKYEILLLGTRGHPLAPSPGANFESVIEAKAREHSRKPDEAYEILEAYFPTVPKVELFARARAPRPGWEHWGFEAEATETGEQPPSEPAPAPAKRSPSPAAAPGPDAAALSEIAASGTPWDSARPFSRVL
jgi:N6-adenosine-specific RNA methylase IME4